MRRDLGPSIATLFRDLVWEQVANICGRLCFTEGAGDEGWKYYGICLGPDGRRYYALRNASPALVIDTETQWVNFIKSGRQNVVWYWGRLKWAAALCSMELRRW